MLRTKLIVSSLATLLLAGSSVVAMAADSGWYAGVSLGQSKVDSDASQLKSDLEALGATGVAASVDDSDTGWKLFGGYQVNKNFAVEAAYVNLGSFTSNATYATLAGSPYRSKTDGDGYLLSVVGTLPVNETFAVFAKAGVFAWNLEATASTTLASANTSADGTDMAYGLGVNWRISKQMGLRAEWDRFQDVGGGNNFNKHDVDLYSLGAVFHF